ncbi:MAG: hypothetical protein IKY83_01370 [Proteobacteria bacterium]|nr:hypothetical protein [Pseudomonadota bacterium]
MTISGKTIAITGQFDGLVASFSEWVYRRMRPNLVCLDRVPREGLSRARWRLGSMISARDTSTMLADVDALVYFCLTPFETHRTTEGLAEDVAISGATNLARCARATPGVRVILVTRMMPDTASEMSCETFLQIRRIFREACPNLSVIETAPLLSAQDALTLSVFESARAGSRVGDGVSWLSLLQPVSRTALFEAIAGQIECQSPSDVTVEGGCAMTWREYFDILSRLVPGHVHLFDRVRSVSSPETAARRAFLNALMAVHSARSGLRDDGEEGNDAPVRRALSDVAHELAGLAFGPLQLHARPGRFEDHFAACYAQRILSETSRDVSSIADLLMEWLPRYFQRAVKVEDMGQNRLMCRVAFIPVVELEKTVEAPDRCRLRLRSPWLISDRQTSLVVTKTAGQNGALLILIEDDPKRRLITQGMRGMLYAFGRYLKAYGCGR